MQAKTGVLLVNLGTPDSPKTKDVRSYLFQFLNDKRVIDIPWLLRKILVNGIIVPFRAPKSAKVYKELWTEQGSPIIYHTHNLCHKLKSILGSEFHVEYAMRYKNPSFKKKFCLVGKEKILNKLSSYRFFHSMHPLLMDL